VTEHILEPAAAAFADVAAHAPPVYELTTDSARTSLEHIQASSISKPIVDSVWKTIGSDGVQARVRIVKPVGAEGLLPVVLYLHGGGWVLGCAATHERLVRELCVGVHAAVVFVDYDRAPEARYPVAIAQAYAAARWISRHGAAVDLDATRLAVAGDSTGGNLAAALAILTQRCGDVDFVHQSLYYPVTDAAQNTASYRDFADGPRLTAKAMAWFWDSRRPSGCCARH
jgi:acetyl esterase